MQKPAILLTLAYLAGLVAGHGFLYFPYTLTVLLLIALIGAALRVLPGRLPLQRLLLIAVPFLFGAAAYLYSAVWLPADHYLRLVPGNNAVHRITGRIVSPLDRDPDRTGFVLRVKRIDDEPASGMLRVSVREAVRSAGYGDVIELSGRLFQPKPFKNPGGFDYSVYLARNGIQRTVAVRNAARLHILQRGHGMFRKIQDWRERIRQAFLSSTSGQGSAILQAMVLGEEGALSDETRDLFLAAGVTHIISISGSHLGMVAVLCFGLTGLLMRLLPERVYQRVTLHLDPKKLAAAITFPLVVFYTLLAGGQTATVRSLIMIAAGLTALLLDRENALLHALALAALLILLINPQALLDISFQLSFVSVLTIGSLVLLWKDLRFGPASMPVRAARGAGLLLLISLSTSLATGPLVVHYFNQFSLAGLAANLVVVPFAGMIVVPLGLLSGVLSLFTNALPLPGLLQFTADAFVSTTGFFARLPIAEFHPPAPGVVWLLACLVLLVSVFLLLRSRLLSVLRPLEYSRRVSPAHLIAAAVSGLLLIALTTARTMTNREGVVLFPDVGQGDCALIQLAGDGNILIDGGGTYDDRFDIGRRVLAPALWNRGVRRIRLVILSHPHPDHMNGLKFVLNKFDVQEVWTHGTDNGLPGYGEFREIIAKRGIRRTIVSPDSPELALAGARISILHPSAGFRSRERKDYAAENDRSLVVRIAYRDRVLLFPGDIGAGVEEALCRTRDVRCDLLKMAHHGSKSSSSGLLLARARPFVAVAGVADGNRYHHPSPEVLQRFGSIGTRIYRTDRDGAVLIDLKDETLPATRWTDLELRRLPVLGGISAAQERENWKRVLIRKWEL